MKLHLTLTLFVLLLGCAVASNRVLIVNLGSYGDASLDLPGNIHNVTLATTLAGSLGFQPQDMKVLQDQQVTREAVQKDLQGWLREGVQPQDRVLVYLAGRGTQVVFQDPQGKSQCQDALLLHNQDPLPVNEVRNLLRNIPAAEVMLVLDTSFRDSLSRAVGVISMVGAQPRSQTLPGSPLCKGASETPQALSSREYSSPTYVELAAASSGESSFSTLQGGLFSRTLSEVVLQNPQVTYGELQLRVNTVMQRFTEQYGLPAQHHTALLPAGWQDRKVRDAGPQRPTLQGTLKGHRDQVQAVAFSPDGNTLAYAVDRYLFLADARTGTLQRVLAGHTGRVFSVGFGPDGKQIVTGSEDGTARLWDVQGGVTLRIFTGHRLAVNAVAFGPDGKQVLTGSQDRTARLWDVQSGKAVLTLSGHDSLVFSVRFSPDGTRLLTASGDVAQLWDAHTGALLQTFMGHTDFVLATAFSPDGKEVLTGSRDQTARVWDAETGEVITTFAGHQKAIADVAFSPDGKGALTASEDGTVRWWDARSGRSIRTFTGHAGAVDALAFNPDGTRVLTGSRDGTAQLWDAFTGQSLHALTGHRSSVDALDASADGKHFLTASGTTALLWEGNTLLRTLSGHTDQVTAVAFSPDGKGVLTTGDYTLRLWDASSGVNLKTFSGHTDLVYSVAFSPDGKFLVSGGKDSTARLWSVNTQETLKVFSGHRKPITSVAFGPDGTLVLTGSEDQTARLWSVRTGETLKVFTGHTRAVQQVGFSADGNLILTSSNDRTLRVWDARTGQSVTAYGVSSPFFRVGKDGTVLVHQDCMTLQHLQLSSGEVLQEFPLGDTCFGDFVVSAGGQALLTDTGQLQDASTLSIFGFTDPTRGFFQNSAAVKAETPKPSSPVVEGKEAIQSPEKRVALVIGNEAYQHAPLLTNPFRDAKLIEQHLKRAGFEVILASNLTRSSFDQALRQFRNLLSEADVALLYYSGHGLQVSGINHMVPVDARLQSPQDVDFETVTVDFVLEQMDREQVPTKLVILDACRTNPFLKNTKSLKFDGLAPMKASKGSLIAFATAPGMPAADGSGLNSPYATALGKHLLTPGLTVEQVFKRVRQDVLKATDGAQEPWENSSLLTDLYFVP